MNIFDVFPDIKTRSILPQGGSPADERTYLEWRRGFEARENAKWLDRMTRFGSDLPNREPIDGGQMDEWLFLNTGGTRMYESPSYQHRLRHLSIAYRTNRRAMIRLAQQYAARRAAACEAK